MKAREEKTCEPSERGVLPSCPHHLPSSYLFLFVLCFPYSSQKVLERRGGRKEGRGGIREQEMAEEREIARQSEEERERGRLNKKNLEREGNER